MRPQEETPRAKKKRRGCPARNQKQDERTTFILGTKKDWGKNAIKEERGINEDDQGKIIL